MFSTKILSKSIRRKIINARVTEFVIRLSLLALSIVGFNPAFGKKLTTVPRSKAAKKCTAILFMQFEIVFFFLVRKVTFVVLFLIE